MALCEHWRKSYGTEIEHKRAHPPATGWCFARATTGKSGGSGAEERGVGEGGLDTVVDPNRGGVGVAARNAKGEVKSPVEPATSRCARKIYGNAVVYHSRSTETLPTDAGRIDQHTRASGAPVNGRPEKERIPFYRERESSRAQEKERVRWLVFSKVVGRKRTKRSERAKRRKICRDSERASKFSYELLNFQRKKNRTGKT